MFSSISRRAMTKRSSLFNYGSMRRLNLELRLKSPKLKLLPPLSSGVNRPLELSTLTTRALLFKSTVVSGGEVREDGRLRVLRRGAVTSAS